MALPITLQTLLEGHKVEDERIEFKKTWDPQASLKTICAFANDLNNRGGGYLVLGVREDASGAKELVGVPEDKADVWLKDILNKCKLIQPDYMPIAEIAQYQNKTFIVLWCPGGSTRPYSSPKTMGKKSERVQWVRRISSTIAPSVEEQRDLYSLANNVPFDDRPNHEASLDDLNIMLIKSYLKAVGSALYDEVDSLEFEELCRNMHIVAGPSEYAKPLNVGLMFFSTDPCRFFPYAQIDVVEFPDGEGGDRLIEHTFTGPLHQQLEDALRYLSNNVVFEEVEKQPDGSPSIRFFNYPIEALKEALANAVYHKGYDAREPVEVRVLPDRIEILSHPGADRSISQDGLREFRMACRRYRNRRIGEFLKELGLTEGRNTGVHKILKSLRENGSREPLFETDDDRLYFMITLYARQTPGADSPATDEGTESRGARQQRILDYLSRYPSASISELVRELGIPRATANRDIATMKGDGRLGAASAPGKWIVAYR